MELWRRVWREGIATQLSEAELTALRDALLTDDERLIQGTTCLPHPTIAFADSACLEGGCALSFGSIGKAVGAAELRFEDICDGADEAMNESAVSRHFLNWYDDTPRVEMRRLLLPEVVRSLDGRCTELAREDLNKGA